MFFLVGHDGEVESQVIIYGAGNDGILTFITLLNLGIYVSAFCDQDRQRQAVKIMNKKVVSPEELFSYDNKDQLIIYIGSRLYNEEIKKSLLDNGFSKIYEQRGDFQYNVSIGSVYRYSSSNWYTIIEQSYKKHIFIFGNSALDVQFADKLRMTDIHIEAFIMDDINCSANVTYPIITVPELDQYPKDKVMVYILDCIPERVRRLEERGYSQGYHYRIGHYLSGSGRMQNPYVCLDVNTGFSYVDFEDTPGYTLLGKDNSEYIVMVLGASATDHFTHYYPSWVSFYYNYLKNAGLNVKIYNGGNGGYTEQQSLFKMIRDLPIIDPDLVVYYGGGLNMVNYLNDGESHFRIRQPFSNAYTENLLNSIVPVKRGYIKEDILRELYGVEQSTEVCVGYQYDDRRDTIVTLVDSYMYVTRCMNAVCMAQGVKFVNFLDPLMIYSEHLGVVDTEKLYNDKLYTRIKRSREGACRFRKEVSQQMDKSFQTDLTQILDGDEMWHDVYHPNEKANMIIAKHVYERTMKVKNIGGA